MSENLEQEYKQLMSEEIPDLWDRIEAGLEPKQPTAEKMSLWRKYRAWGTAAAACLCLMIIVPVIYGKYARENFTGGSTNSADNGAVAGDSLAQNSYSYATEGNAAMDSMYGEAFEEGEAVNGGALMTNDDVDSEMPEVNGTASEQEPLVSETGMVYTVRATVIEISEAEGRMMYTVQIEEANSAGLSEGDIIRLYDEGVMDAEPAEGEVYLFDISVLTVHNGETEYLINEIRYE